MQPFGLSMNELALELRVPATRISEIVHGQRAITTDTALRLARFFGTTPQFWLNLQQLYDLEVAEQLDADDIARQVQPLKGTGVILNFPAVETGEAYNDTRH